MSVFFINFLYVQYINKKPKVLKTMQINLCQSETCNQDDSKPPGIFSLVTNTEHLQILQMQLPCYRVSMKSYSKFMLFQSYVVVVSQTSQEIMVLSDQILLKYSLQGQSVQFLLKDHIDGEIFQFSEISYPEFDNLLNRLKTKCLQNNFNQLFLIKGKAGKGKSSQVLLAQRKIDRTLFAVKAQKDSSKLREEVQILRELQHPNLIYFRQLFIQSDGTSYIVMDYEDGGSLLQKIHGVQQLSYKQKLKIVIDMINALQFLRLKKIVHRDIKPQNIIYSKKDKNYKIADFGLAMRVGDRINKISGTPGYMAPQLLKSQQQSIEINVKSDIYSMGLTFYQIFTSEQYYQGQTHQQILQCNIKSISFKKKSYQSNDPHRIQKKLLQKMIRSSLQNRQNSYQIMTSSVFNKITRYYQQQNRPDSQTKIRSSSSEEQKFMDAVKRLLRIKTT